MTRSNPSIRNACRVVLFCSCQRLVDWQGEVGGQGLAVFEHLAEAGDIASVVFNAQNIDQTTVQSLLEPITALLQARGIAVIVDGDTRTAGRIGADGLQIGAEAPLLQDTKAQHGARMMVGVTNVKTRHNALLLGEGEPDYIMFGKQGTDTRPEPHPKNIELGQWWSAMVEIPCIVLGGNTVESVVAVAQSGVEFVGLETAIFGSDEDAATRDQICDRLRTANQLLDDYAPVFESLD